MADDTCSWIEKLNVGSKIDFCRKYQQKERLYRTAIVESMTTNTITLHLIHGEDSDTDSSDSELLNDLCININDIKDKQRIAPFNTIAMNLIKCKNLYTSTFKIIPHIKYNESILSIDISTGRSDINQYKICDNDWLCIVNSNPFIRSKHYTPILNTQTDKIYFLYTSRKTLIKPPETRVAVLDIHSLKWNIVKINHCKLFNDCKLFKHTLVNKDESSSQTNFHDERSGVDACCVNINSSIAIIYILNYESDLIKLELDEEHNIGNFEVISKTLNEHYGMLYSESLRQFITFTDEHIVYYDMKCKQWKQYKHMLPIATRQLIYTLIYDHIIVFVSQSRIWFYDLCFEKIFQCKKCVPEIWFIEEMSAINFNDEFIHLVRTFNGGLFGCSWKHIKLLLDDIIPQQLTDLYLRRKELLCVGFLTKLTEFAVPMDIVNLIALFFRFLN